ncbi:GTP-binding protein [Arboricoccus pini]|uniref:Large ribosomal subunit assembly factor BipA n=1 Tax=Arboricoccus pini TaxID=1963835 RepID=A0A212QV19_9PROT|nr:translational GTPase TypA [Arboricoccus pini]SNB63530.1 GTP-binding protein [Arboricoccus pini]
MDLRNIAIIAHVDHGKTTMVDKLLQQSGTFRENQQVQERAMDSNDIERERGITILAKCTSVVWQDVRINIVDTPGHADFGGEVERILSMVDSCVLLVDAAEGPMPQTKFVLGKALKQGLKPIVVINKVDKPEQRADEVLNEIFDLFAALEATEEQLDFPYAFASAKNGWAVKEMGDEPKDLSPLFELILSHVQPPAGDKDGPFRMLATTLEANNFLGRILTGRITSGTLRPNTTIKALSRDGNVIETARITKILGFRGLERVPVDEAEAGDIVAIAGLTTATVADSIVDPSVEEPLPAQPIDPSTIAMTFAVNDSPYAGTEGTKVTTRQIWDRLQREAEGNVAIRVSQSENADAYEVAGRGELQLAVLIETMRREGFELSISRPRVLFRNDENGKRLEPIEEVTVDVDEEYSGIVVEKLSQRKAELTDMRPAGAGKQRIVFLAPARALIGYYGEFLTDTRGTGVLNRVFHSWEPYKGAIAQRHTGVLISSEQGESVAYALWNLEDRGPMFIGAGEKIYAGMIIGQHTRGNDLEVNPVKGKKLTNVRASGTDEAVRLTPPIPMSLEKAIAYIADDELVEVTPKSIRLRKRYLDPNMRKRMSRQQEVA